MQCKPDAIDNVNSDSNELKITTRTCEPGDYTISDNRIVFADTNEYHKTLEYLACASEASISGWADEITIETPGKDYRDY